MQSMKIITWNCNMAFRKKAEFILAYKPDILVVPECEHPDKLKFDQALPAPTNILWFGSNKNKGLGIFFVRELPITSNSSRNYNVGIKDDHSNYCSQSRRVCILVICRMRRNNPERSRREVCRTDLESHSLL